MKRTGKSCEVIPMSRVHLPIGGTSPDIVNVLESLIVKAERGELLGLVVGYVEGNNEVRTQIASGSADAGLLVAAASSLCFEINARWSGR